MIEFYWFAIGNIAYYLIAIVSVAALKDNRAFCVYICPIPPLQKVLSRYALLKMSIVADKCNDCYLCEMNCPMGINLLSYKNEGKRILSTECIICYTCANVCLKEAMKMTMKFDKGERKEYLRYR